MQNTFGLKVASIRGGPAWLEGIRAMHKIIILRRMMYVLEKSK
jgi:hypothetical protein